MLGPDVSFLNDRNARVNRNLVEDDVAADPTGAACGSSERLAAFKGGKCKSEMGNENDCLNGPLRKVVVQDIKIRRAVFKDGSLHLGVRSVHDSGADWSALALQLKRRLAGRTNIVDRGGPLRRSLQTWGFAGRTEEI